MADGDHCHSIVIDGDRIIFNRPMYLSVYYEQHEDDFVPGGLVLTFWDNHRREEPNQPERPMSPLQQIAANEESLPVLLAPSEEPEDFLLYDYYDTEYSDTEDYDTGDSDRDEFDPGIGGSESGDKQGSAEEEQDQHRDGGSRKRAREDDEEEEECRSSQRFRPDCDSVLGNIQTEAAAFPHTGAAASRGEQSSVVHMESMVHIDPGGEERQEDNMGKLLPTRSTNGGGSQEGADEKQRALPLHSWRPPFMMAFWVFLLVGFQIQEGLINWNKVQQGGKTQF